MTDRYERIRAALAMGPTPGPWVPKELPRDMQRDGYKFSISRGGLGCWIAKVTHEANGGSGAANAALIAACDPDTARALLEERDGLTAENARLREERDALLDALRQIAEWPDGGNRYGQEKIKRFAQHAIDAAIDRARGKGVAA